MFYRGVSSAVMPIAARLTPDAKILVQNLGQEEIPAVIRIESRGGKLCYRAAGAVHGQSVVEPPTLTATRDALRKDVESLLIARGLFVDEARAMMATWQDSWFEEGSRLLYILPAAAVNTILPLAVNPEPAATVRVFVGRLELVTPATQKAVEQDFEAHDEPALDRYRRFLEPILNAVRAASASDPDRVRILDGYLNSVYTTACRSPWPEQQ